MTVNDTSLPILQAGVCAPAVRAVAAPAPTPQLLPVSKGA